uniref:PP4R3 domain-containing protein n=1 Tax=Ascaris lumbricoides TaxID=6252 RepID=A0A0M3ICN8_ASCLU
METLIVWSESDTCDLALSFQDKSGCEHIWEKICQVQGRDPEQHPAASAAAVTLPPCELSRLQDLEILLSSSFSSAQLREKVALAIETQGYVGKLCDLFHMCEDLENIEALRIMHQIARDMFMLNRNGLLEVLLSENYFKDIVGMLEYDPSQSQPRKHREFLFEKARFREVFPIRNEDLRQKIHQTYRVQYVQDVCLPAPSLFEENLLSVLNSYLFFNRVDIVSMLQDDKQLLKKLFDQLKDPSTSTERRKDLTMFLKEFCSFSTSLQPNGPQGREVFYKTLMQNDVLATIEPCIMSKDPQTMATTVEMFVMIVEFNPQIARDYLLQQGRNLSDAKNDQVLLNKLIERMLTDTDPELTSGMAMAQVMRSLLDPDNMISAPNSKCERHEFLTFFYRRSMETLCRPIIENTAEGVPKKDDYHTANKQAMVVDLLCFCFEHHAVHMRNYCISNKLLNKVLVLLQSKHHFLALSQFYFYCLLFYTHIVHGHICARKFLGIHSQLIQESCFLGALRLLRRVVQLKDEFYFRYIVRDDVIRPVVQCFRANGHRYNLLNSAIIELFEFIRTEDIKVLVSYVVEKYGEQFDDVTYVKTFTALRIKYEQMKDQEGVKVEDSPSKSPSSESSTSAQWKKERQADADEQWFNDDDTEVVNVAQTASDGWDTSKQQREGAANGAARSPLRDDSDSIIKPSGEDISPSSSAGSSPIKEQPEDDKDSDASVTPMRKSGAEPNFPSVVKRKRIGIVLRVLDDDSDDVFSPATNASRIRGTPRIVIKNVAQTASDGWDTSKQQREGAANGAARSPLRDDSDSIIKPSGEDISPSSSAGSSPIKEQPEDDKDSDASVTPMRKSGAEPNFPSVVKRKLLDDDSDDVFSPATNASRIRGTPRIVIKMNNERRSPCRSPPVGSGSPPGDPVVSSTEVLITPSSSSPLERPSAPPPSTGITVLVKKALVDYDESDSDEEEESAESSLPSSSSSAGRPSSNPSSQSSSTSADDHDDVSSTSGDHEPSPGFLSGTDDGNEQQHGEDNESENNDATQENVYRKRAAKHEVVIEETKHEGDMKDEETTLHTGGKRLRLVVAVLDSEMVFVCLAFFFTLHFSSNHFFLVYKLEASEDRDDKTGKLAPAAGLVS